MVTHRVSIQGLLGFTEGILTTAHMEAHRGPYTEDNSLVRGRSPLPCSFAEVYVEGSSSIWILSTSPM